MSVKIIACVSSNGVIGKDGNLPFHYSEDLKHFKKMTLNSTIIMGRKTFKSIDCKPLPKRRNIVISHSIVGIPGIETYSDLEYAISDSLDEFMTNDIWLIGGNSIYYEGMKYANEILLTITPDMIQGDNLTFFPWINPKLFKIDDVQQINDESLLKIYKYKRM